MHDRRIKISNIDEYKEWLKNKHKVFILPAMGTYYKTVASKIKSDFEQSVLWVQLVKNLPEFNDEYLTRTGYNLLMSNLKPILDMKHFDSFLLKTFRRNVIENARWPDEPDGGWILPSNWYCRINDIVRTLLMVKYLDGVEFLLEKLRYFFKQYGSECEVHLEAKEEGYYAAHLYTKQESEIPKFGSYLTEKVNVSIEIQITTQLQEVIRGLLHKHYENRRRSAEKDANWQWNYRSDEFATNYLGHMLHYIEGMIMDIRERQKEQST